MKNKTLIRASLVFFIALLGFTFVSYSVYNASLPVVTTVMTEKGSIVQSTTTSGELFEENAEICVKFSLPFSEDSKVQPINNVTVEYNSLITYLSEFDEVIAEKVEPVTSIASIKSRAISEDQTCMEYVAVLDSPEGDVLMKSNTNITVSSKSEGYSYIVPSSCVRRDADGDYIFRLIERNSLFGKEYCVERVTVTIKAQNGHQSAIDSQDILISAQIVYSTTLPLYNGSTVAVQ